MKENFGIKDAQEMGAVGNEALDRHNLKPRDLDFVKDEVRDEDDERVKANDPNKGYITAADLADDAYLNYGEGDETNKEGGEVAGDDNERIDDSAEIDLDAIEKGLDSPVDYKIEELNPENNGIIGAASVSAEEGKIYVSREEGETAAEPYELGDGLIQSEGIAEKYELEGVDAEDMPLRAENAKILGYSSRKYDRGQTHVSDGRKIQKRHGLRSLIRNIIKPGSN